MRDPTGSASKTLISVFGAVYFGMLSLTSRTSTVKGTLDNVPPGKERKKEKANSQIITEKKTLYKS